MRVFQFIILFFSIILLKDHPLQAQSDDIGSGRALQFDGVDDYISLGNVYDDLQFPITISAWVLIDQNVTDWAPVFVTQDNAPIYNGFWLIVQPTRISIGYGDGFGENNPAFRRSKTADFPSISNRWTHITGIIRGAVDMDLFVNGINVGGSYSGFTDNPMSNTATDIAKIGYWFSNSQSFHFKGKLDEIRLWSKSLTTMEIRSDLCRKLSGPESNLIGYWNFNELNGTTLFDKSARSHSGTLIGNPTRVFSGAPLGETSLNTYRTDWTNFSFEIADGENKLVASNVKGSPEGIHLYKVTSSPSQTAGLNASLPNKPYFGVFLASLDNDNSFDASYLFEGKSICKAYIRNDNSSASWTSNAMPIKTKLQRSEFVKDLGAAFVLDLGNDLIICDNQEVILDTRISEPDVSFLWSTGQTTSNIKVNFPGKYWVKAENTCGIATDTLTINLIAPLALNLGSDLTICTNQDIVLDTKISDPGVSFLWSTGQKTSSIKVNLSGKYWVKAENSCDIATDTLILTIVIPITLNLGSDLNMCTNQEITLDTKITDPHVSFLWSTGQTTSNIKVNLPGKYWVKVENFCGVVADTLLINLVLPPPSFSLGDDETLCEFDPIVLKPYANSAGYQFTWQDNSTGDSFLVKDFGAYSVKAKNACGESSDMITFAPTTYELPELTNVITPNGDLYNEYFVVEEDGSDYGQIELLIVNRWGKQVYFSDDYKNDWNGGDLSSGVYFYTLYGTCINKTKGSLSIVR
jgi:gliding motility-associated-like protein